MKPASKEHHGGLRVRRGGPSDSAGVANLLLMNGIPGRMAREEAFLLAEGEGGVLAVLSYRVESRSLTLGVLAADPWAGERVLARLLYAEAHALARELGLGEVRAPAGVYGDYPHEVGYGRRPGGWRLGTDQTPELRDELPEGGWRRMLALLGRGGASVPYFSAFGGRRNGLPS